MIPGALPGVKIAFATSANCGGSCAVVQGATLETEFAVTRSGLTLTADAAGLIEAQDAGFERLTVSVNGVAIINTASNDNNAGCTMENRNESGSTSLPVGCHKLQISTTTVDAQFHAGAYWQVTFTLSGDGGPSCDGSLSRIMPMVMPMMAVQEILPNGRVKLAAEEPVVVRKPEQSPEEQDPTGPGTMLTKVIAQLGITADEECACKKHARQMNTMGNDWCEENISLIVGWLREEATRRKMPFVDLAGKILVKRAISLSRQAKKKAATDGTAASPGFDSQEGPG